MKIKILLFIAIIISILFYFSLPKIIFKTPFSKVVESADGRLLSARIASDGQWRFPQRDSVPYKFKKALVTFEDKRFFSHFGVDILAVGRAVRQNIKSKNIESGASTLTMQTIRISRNKGRTIYEKIYETILAICQITGPGQIFKHSLALLLPRHHIILQPLGIPRRSTPTGQPDQFPQILLRDSHTFIKPPITPVFQQ